ncbi:hypothetical protein H5R88_08350 [Limosilactobacillus sp. WF-MT5-A]|uniref:hypothetical protein n=1 Tax=Limosilactobacillus agrestis TaxID=2759748 RepID=UPI0015F9B8C0|nr:hypothetical protein [Limosilactobacillus agrestis]MBB1100095.1 hypothetical protein [Limosilactobacillus agrestis]MCD7127355.1 hypothetical protein [Limosilactobacillus agrestis]
MREIKIPNVSQKRTDNLEKYLIQLIDDGKPTPLDQSVNYRAFITYDGSLVTPTGIELTIQDNQLVLDSAKLDLPAGIYRFEIWAEKDGQRAIYPDTGMKWLVINSNATDLPNGTVTSLTLDEFVKEFKNLVKDVGNSSNPNQGGNIEASIDTDKRTITINGKSLTIPEQVDLSGLASKDDIAGLVKQTELAEYVKKNDLPSIPNMTDYVKKEELPKQPDLAKYALKSDLPDLTGYAKMSDLPSVTDLVKKSELANYAKKSDLPVIPDLTLFLKTADADKKFATKSEIPSLDGYAKKTDLPKEPDLSNYATKDDLKTVTSNITRHGPTGFYLDRTTNPMRYVFDNGCTITLKSGFDNAIAGDGFGINEYVNSIEGSWPLANSIMSYAHGTVTHKIIEDSHGSPSAIYNGIVITDPVNDATVWEWSNVFFNDKDRQDFLASPSGMWGGHTDYGKYGEREYIRMLYSLGLMDETDIQSFGAVKKEG